MEISSVLEQFKQGSSKHYDLLIAQLSDPAIQPPCLLNYLKNLKDCVTQLDKQHENIIGVLLRLRWTQQNSQIIQEYQSLIVHLVSVHTDYLKAVLRMIVKNFISDKPTIEATTEDLVKQTEHGKFAHVHKLLRAVNSIVPMTGTQLIPLLSDLFPHQSKSAHTLECYVTNLLQISQYMPEHRHSILELIVDRLVKLDVSCPRHEIQSRLEEEDGLVDDGMFDLEESESTLPEARKLDCLMKLMFTYIQNTCYSDNTLNWGATKLLYRQLLSVFEKVILPTYASCHIQFIMFYMCSLKPALYEGFIDYLWKRVQDPNCQAVFRQTAVSYIGSLLARGKFITLSTVMSCLDLMMQWVHTYLDGVSQEFIMADIARHGPFYSVCQAVFYVVVFWSKEIFEHEKGVKWAEGLNFQRVVTSRLNPLKVCQPVIVKTFSSITRQHQLAFCETIIERNNRSVLPVYIPASDTGVVMPPKMLDSFFPFDPYLLAVSLNFVSPHYREFGGTLEVEESSDEEDDMFTEDIAVSPAACGIHTGSVTVDQTIDLMSYGTSPGFQHL